MTESKIRRSMNECEGCEVVLSPKSTQAKAIKRLEQLLIVPPLAVWREA